MSPYRRSVPSTWWLHKRSYFLYILRELTSVPIAVYVILLLVTVRKIALGPVAYQAWLAKMASPWMIAFHLVALLAAVYHMATWFELTPSVMPVRVGGEKLPAPLLVGANYVAWIAVSAVIVWVIVWS